MATSPMIKDMLKAWVHIWQKKQYWSPKMRDYLHGVQNGIHVIDLYKTIDRIESVKKALQKANKEWKEIVIVWTKIQARDWVKAWAEETWHHYVNEKWAPGLLTNFFTIKWRIQAYKKLKKELESNELDWLSKKDRSAKVRELEKLEKRYAWLVNITRKPDVIIVLDWYYDSLALVEANKLWIQSYAVFGTTWDPDMATDFIPANVNTFKSIEWVLSTLNDDMKKVAQARPSTQTRRVPSKRPAPRRKPIAKQDPVKQDNAKKDTVKKEETAPKKD